MADIRAQVSDQFIDKLRKAMHLKSNTDVIQEALTLLSWATEERERNRLILSTNTAGGSVERLAMGSLSSIQPKVDNQPNK